jgi:predicted ATPase/DNA-binding XRE family transcriptional regulator
VAFGELLRYHRRVAGLTQEQLAERAGMSPRGLAYLERGDRTPHRDTIQRLADALGLDPSSRDTFEAAARFVAPATSSALAPGGLRAPLTPLIGRECEMAAIATLLVRSRTRLLTLTGPGGVGKTLLALRVAEDVRDEFADGTIGVALASIRDPDLVVSTIARALALSEIGGHDPVERLATALGSKQLLLLLDNFEQLLPAAPRLTELLTVCPGLTILVTSRAALRVRGEQELAVPPLVVPAAGEQVDQEAIARSPAVTLFAERARAVRPDFGPTPDEIPVLAEICRRLDGLPLAIELAAARIKMLSPRALLARLDRRLPLLTGGPRDLPVRLRTLRDAIAWSCDLLDEDEQRLFRRLAVFSGGCTLEAIDEVTWGEGRGARDEESHLSPLAPQPSSLDLVGSLIGKSLVQQQPQADGEPRFSMLETIREYAAEQLDASEEGLSIRGRHAAYCLALAEAAEPELTGPNQGTWLRRLDQEHANIRAALQWLRAGGDREWQGLRLATALWRFWWQRSHFAEGRHQLRTFLALAGKSAPTALRARALHASGELAFRHGDSTGARGPLEAALALCEQIGDRLGTALALTSLGRLALDEGRHADARVLLEAGLEIERDLDYRTGLPWALTYLSWVAIFERDHPRADALLAEGLRLCHDLEDREGIGRHLFSLGHLALDRGDAGAAWTRFAESLEIFAELGYKYGIAYALEGLADVALTKGDREQGIRLAAAAAGLRETIGVVAAAEFQARHGRALAQAKSALPADAAETAWQEGCASSLEQIVRTAVAPDPST